MTRVLVTGASGFIGAALARDLRAAGVNVRTAARCALPGDHAIMDDLTRPAAWRAALTGVSAVVHLAGPAHARPSAEGERAITEGAAVLARTAEEAGVTRVIYISSAHAAAKRTGVQPISECDAPAPHDPYGRAKLAAEQTLLAHAALNPIALRPPLVFAPDAKANFALLLRLAASPLPLPLAGVSNARSLISRESVIAAVRAVLVAPGRAGGVFFIADRPALSTSGIIAALRRGLGRAPLLFPAGPLLAFAPAPLRQSLAVDDSAFRAAFGYGARAHADTRADLEACARAWKAAA
ncbi:MAG: NAD-dependent epimerase/dehydratase family protein [Hyphomonadaceae bacterium]|nr:NAD-dependent epimerase/dehydratase family protein [Hyphomonadaceae bacterium]MBX3511902.1 NAD-dependent epimerase/dehydratase family protein [Hyphomonadaceae bacterium]